MLNVKQESCEYQLFGSLGLTRPGNRTQVYQLSLSTNMGVGSGGQGGPWSPLNFQTWYKYCR